MKISIFLLSFLFQMNTFQHNSIEKLLCSAMWYPTKYNREIPTLKEDLILKYTSSSTNSHDATTYLFNVDGSFIWSDNPSCGTNAYAVAGIGSWHIEKDNLLILDFKNTMTEQRGKRKIEQYKIISITEEELALKRLE